MDGYTMEIREFIGSRPLILVGSTIIVFEEMGLFGQLLGATIFYFME